MVSAHNDCDYYHFAVCFPSVRLDLPARSYYLFFVCSSLLHKQTSLKE